MTNTQQQKSVDNVQRLNSVLFKRTHTRTHNMASVMNVHSFLYGIYIFSFVHFAEWL